MPSNGIELLNKKETCMVEVWKDEKKDCTIGVINILYNSDEENTEGYNVWTDNSKISQVTRSGKGYKLVEKKVEKAIEKEEVVGEVSAIRDEQKQVIAPPSFQVAIISAGIERNPRVSSMIKKMNYQSGQGLGKNE